MATVRKADTPSSRPSRRKNPPKRAKIGSDEWYDNEYVIAKVEQVEFDPETGEKISAPYEYTTNVRTWNQVFLPNLGVVGLSVIEVIHLPELAKKPEYIGYPKNKRK